MNSTVCGKIFVAGLLVLFLPISVRGQNSKEGLAQKRRLEAEALFFDASKAEILENLKEAITLYEKSLSIDPENAAAHFRLATLLSRDGRGAEGLGHARKSTKLDPSNSYYWIQLGEMEEAAGNWKDAVKAYRYLVEHFPDQAQFRLSVAQIYMRNRKFKEANKELEKAQVILGPSPELFQLRQRIYLQQNDLPGAVAVGRSWMKEIPDEPDPYYALAQLLLTNNKLDEAREVLLQAVERFPAHPTGHLLLADYYINKKDEARADSEMVRAFESPDLPIGAKIDIVSGYLRGMDSPGEKQKAITLCDLILKVHPDDPRAFIIRGDILNRANDKRGARDMYLKAKNRDKNNFGLWEQLVLIDLNLNEIDSVVAHTAEARVLFPNTPTFAFYNGLGNLMKKQYAGAVEALEHARRISAENREMQLEIFSQLGDAYYNLKEFEKSFAAFDEALRLDSTNSHVLNNYSYFLSLEKSQLEKALRMSTRLVRLHPEDPTFLDTHGWVLYQKGEYSLAVEPLEKAAMASNSGVIWEHYGDALFKTGKKDEAVNAWKRASGLGGDVSAELGSKVKEGKMK